MGEIFNLDNKFFQAVSKIVDCVWLSLLWMLFCIPIFTAGAATTALYYSVNKSIRHGRGYAGREFWEAFRTNFKQATVIWLICIALMAFIGTDCFIMYRYAKAGERIGSIYIVFVVFFAFLMIWQAYLFPYIARFAINTKRALKNAVLVAIANPQSSVLLLLLIIILSLVVGIFPPLVIIMPSVYMVLANLIIERVFRKYMSEEDLAAEDERNRDYLN